MRRAAAAILAAVVAALLAPPAARAVLDVERGLTTQSFSTTDRAGTRSFGYLTTLTGGRFQFEIRAAAPAVLQVDGRSAAELELSRGAHFVLIEVEHVGAAPPFELLWGRDGAAPVPVPGWRLSPDRVEPWRLIAVRGLEWLRAVVVVLALAVLGGAAWRRWHEPLDAAARRWPRAAAFALFALLAVVHTWPLASAPASLSRHDNSDAMLNEWALAWVAHQAVRDPLHLFDANIFFPEPNALAYSEAMLVQGLLGAPLAWAGAPSLLVYNAVLLAGFALTGWATALVAARWTGDWRAGIAAGLVAAFNAHTLTRLPHLQALHVEFLPLALAALDTLLREPRPRHALRLAGWFALQSLASLYLLVFSAFALVAATLARPREWLGRRFAPAAGCLLLAAAASGLLLLPYLEPYWQVHRDQGAVRSLIDAELYAASWKDYLSTPARLHFAAWSRRWFTGAALFPGVAALALAAIAIGRGVAWRDPRARMCLAFGAAGFVLSFGVKVPGYAWLYETLPLLQAVRAVSRFGSLAILAVAFLAAFGFAALAPRLPRGAAAALLALLALEPLAAPVHFTRGHEVAPVYETLAREPDAVVVELPMPGGFGWFGNARYMLNSTRHWQPLLNGYSGFAPRSFHEHTKALAPFPAPEAIAALAAFGVTHVVVHADGYTADQRAQLEAAHGLAPFASSGRTWVYRVTAAAPPRR